MGHRAGLCATVVVVASSLLWLLLVAGIVTGPAQAQRGRSVSVGTQAAASPQGTLTVDPTPRPVQQKEHRAQQAKKLENKPVPAWIPLAVLLLGCAVLLAALVLLLWGRTHPDRYRKLREKADGLLPWHQRGQPAGWTYEVLVGLLTGLAVAAGLAAQVLAGNVSTGPAVFLIVAVAVGLAAAVVQLRWTQRKNERRWAEQVRRLLREPLGKDGRLPRLSALNPYRLGVSPSRYGSEERRGDDPYVLRRVTDKELDQELRSTRFVLVVGDSKAGKSRTAYEAATRLCQAGRPHDPRVLVAKSTDDLGPLLDLDPPLDLQPEPALLWLDDLTESALAELTPALLDRLTEHMIVLGTLTAQRHSRVWDIDSDISRTARQALLRATVIRLEAVLDGVERADAEQKYPQERFEAGIGEQLVAVDQLSSRYDDARQGANPQGWAVVQAAIDWTRMDVGRPITQPELVALCPLYLGRVRVRSRHDDEKHEEALRWACEPVVSHIALLTEVPNDRGEPSYEPFDYLVAAADGQDGRRPQPILDSAWDTVLALVSPPEALRTGVSAYLRQLPLRAQKIFTAVAAENSHAAPVAAVSLGVLLQKQGDVEGAKVFLQMAIDSRHADAAPMAAVSLGQLLQEQGDLAEAKIFYQRAIDSRHTDAAPMAAVSLGRLLQKQGDLAGAKVFYQMAIDSRHAEVAPIAAVSLGRLPEAAFSLGRLLSEQGNVEGAKAAYRQAIDSGHAEVVPKAAVSLGQLLEEQGDVEEAKVFYQMAIDSGHAEAAPIAAVSLGRLLSEQGDVEGAKAAYRQAIASEQAEVAPMAGVGLGGLLGEQGDVEEAKVFYQMAIDSRDADMAPIAAVNFGVLLGEQGDVEGAKVAYRQAIDSGHADVAPKAAFNLGRLLQKQGDLAGAKVFYQMAIDSGHAEAAPWAADNLGRLLRSTPPPAAS